MGGLTILCAVGCGVPDQVFVQFQSQSRVSGGFYSQGQTVEFWAETPAPLVADVKLQTDDLRFDAHFDYAAGMVVLDGHGGALDQPSHALLADAVEARALSIGADLADLPLEQKALYTALVSWEQSGGISLDRLSIPVDRRMFGADQAVAISAPSEGAALGRPSSSSSFPNGAATLAETVPAKLPRHISSGMLALDAPASSPEQAEPLGAEATRCVSRGQSYEVSYDDGSSTTDEIDTVDTQDCNGSCSPGCLQLSPYPMWTLACLGHDACCRASGDADCWAPDGACADEYAKAMADFVRGLDPSAPHCEG